MTFFLGLKKKAPSTIRIFIHAEIGRLVPCKRDDIFFLHLHFSSLVHLFFHLHLLYPILFTNLFQRPEWLYTQTMLFKQGDVAAKVGKKLNYTLVGAH